MSNTSLVIILLVTLVLTVVVSAVSEISSLPLQAKAETPGQNQNGKDQSSYIGDKDLLQADATIIAGILILLTISSIKDSANSVWFHRFGSICSFGDAPYHCGNIWLHYGTLCCGMVLIMSRLSAIAGFVILTVVLRVIL